MDKCPKNMTLVALNIFGLITILDFFQDTFVSIFKTKRPSDYFAFFSFLLCGGQAYFYIFVFGLLGSTTGRWPHFFFFFFFFFFYTLIILDFSSHHYFNDIYVNTVLSHTTDILPILNQTQYLTVVMASTLLPLPHI